jgi:hypothetical protein
MRFFPAAVLPLILILSAGSNGAGHADPSLQSGPQPGQIIPGPFHFFNATGAHAGKPHCLVCEYGLRPVVMVFAREIPDAGSSQPLISLLQKLDEAVGRYPQRRLRSFGVFLSNDATNPDTTREVARKLDDVAKGADLKNVVLAVGGPDGPQGYKLSKMTDKDVSAVLSAVVAMVGAKK